MWTINVRLYVMRNIGNYNNDKLINKQIIEKKKLYGKRSAAGFAAVRVHTCCVNRWELDNMSSGRAEAIK